MKRSRRWLKALPFVFAAAAVFGVGTAAAQAPQNSMKPTITGTAREGQTLTANPGHWTGAQPMDFSYQWRRCSAAATDCTNIPQATDKLYTVRGDDVGKRLRVVVTAANKDGANSAVSTATAVIRAAPPAAPQNTALPSISGTAEVGETLTATAGSWTGTQPIDFAYRWRRCDDKGGDCANTDVTGLTYKLGVDDVNKTLRVLVTATNSVGAGAAMSNATSVVRAKAAQSGACASVAGVDLPERLIIDRIVWSPGVITSVGQTITGRFHVTTTKSGCVSGALVYAVGVPFDRLSKGAETQTAGDGWATISFRVLPTFKLRRGNFVVVFVRARKAGDSVLAGVSTRRLVSVRVG